MNFSRVLHILSLIVLLIGFAMTPSFLFSCFYREPDLYPWICTILITLLIGYSIYKRTEQVSELNIKEAFCVVGLSWIVFAGFGAIPYLFSGVFSNFIDAYFEAMSGFTTTGATVITNIEALPHGILFWRSFTHWLGGMGVIVLSLVLLPLLGIGGVQLFKAESPGPSADKLTPKIAQTAKILWQVYVLLSVIEVILLYLGGMSLFDSFCHTFGTMATGGFSTKNASIGAFNSLYIEGVITVFMFLAGVNFALHYRFLIGNFNSYFKNKEFVFYSAVIIFAVIAIVLNINGVVYDNLGDSLRYGVFQVVSIVTTTGFCTANFDQWPAFSKLLLVFLMFLGGCAGSTGGGMKHIRVLLLLKYAARELKVVLFPKAVFAIKLGDEPVSKDVMKNVLGFFVISMFLFIGATLAMSLFGLDLVSAFTSVVATLWNIGPGLARVGAIENYAHISYPGKIVLSFCMVLGRLEIFTILLLFTRSMWKK